MPHVPRSEPDEDVLEALVNYAGIVLTAPDGPSPVTKDQRMMAAALDNGTLLVKRSSPLHHHIASVRAMLRRQGQIGRAACRESVCQYVESLVVAGSINNKEYKNTDDQTHKR